MKTSVVMTRKMGDFNVTQRTKDGMFNATALLKQWNIANEKDKRINEFLNNNSTKDFIEALHESHREKSPFADFQALTVVKGKNTKSGKTPDTYWLKPLLFIDFALWLNPKFKVKVLEFVYDELIKNRHLAGDNYKVLSSAGVKLKGYNFVKVAVAIQWIVFNKTGKDLRQTATQKQLQEITALEQKFAFAIDMGYIKTYKQLIKGLQDTYKSKGYTPIKK